MLACYTICITDRTIVVANEEVFVMFIKIDFNSDEAFYIQLRNQIIYGIATSKINEGDILPSVRAWLI